MSTKETITFQQAIRALNNTDSIIFEDTVIFFDYCESPDTTEELEFNLNGDSNYPDEDVITIKKSDNLSVEYVDSSMFLKDSSGETFQITLLKSTPVHLFL